MCGVLFHLDHTRSPREVQTRANRVFSALDHRGPDALGMAGFTCEAEGWKAAWHWTRDKHNDAAPHGGRPGLNKPVNVLLGHHRLSIIDLAEAAHQPCADPSQQVFLSFNGEVYNYRELREELQHNGHLFRTQSDTEVVLYAYLEWGEDCFTHFNGDFAIILVDLRRGVVVGARDRFGVKPLYYHHKPNTVTFASEVRAITPLLGNDAELDSEVAFHYLTASFPTPKTLQRSFVEGVLQIPAGHVFRYSLDQDTLHVEPYWMLSARTEACTFCEAAERFDELLADAVRLRLQADVPVGSFLSGGMDSTSVVQYASKHVSDIATFSSVFPGTSVDESSLIRDVVDALGVQNIANTVDFHRFTDEIQDVVRLQDEPFSTLNVYTQYQNLALAAEAGFKVMLDGGGADEFLAGYDDYRILAAADTGTVEGLTPHEQQRVRQLLTLDSESLRRHIHEESRQQRMVPYLDDTFRRRHRNGFQLDRPLDPLYQGRLAGSLLKHALFHSMCSAWMNKSVPWDNRYLDRSGMALGIEPRVPFQDHRVVEWVFRLPPEYIATGQTSKRLLRKVMRGRLPETVVNQKRKIGFEFPFVQHMQSKPRFASFFEDLATSQRFGEREWVQQQAVRRELAHIRQGKSRNYNLWRVFNLHLWMQEVLETPRRREGVIP